MFLKKLLDILYPLQCLSCGGDGEILCRKCLVKIPCDLTASQPIGALDGLICATTYRHVDQYVQMLKYQFVTVLAEPLGQLMAQRASLAKDFVCCPVPLHPRRLRERGFNQSKLLAEQLDFPVRELLTRIRYTRPQAELNRDQRLTNLKGKFALKSGVEGQKIVLIDDVYTTGTTLQECALTLKNGGAAVVWGLVLARD